MSVQIDNQVPAELTQAIDRLPEGAAALKHVAPSFGRRLWQERWFYLFISPFFLLFAVLGLYPLVFSLYLSFTQWDSIGPINFVGLANFRTLLLDGQFYNSLLVTVIIGCMYIPPMFILAFGFAVLLNDQTIRLRGLIRAGVFIPCITPMVVIAFVFQILYDTKFGLLNWIWTHGFGWLGAAPIPWLESGTWAKISVSILLVWRWTGYNMVLMLAGLQGISADLYEAATLDGAGRFQRMWHVTVPLMRPTLTFCAIMSLIGTAFMFDEVFVLTKGGGPGTATNTFGMYLFNQGFSDFRFGYASAAAYVVAAVVFLLSLATLRGGRSAV